MDQSSASPAIAPTVTPTLTVVIPVWDEADSIGSVLDDIAAAFDGAAPFEVLCVDDGSGDATPARLAEKQGAYPWLRVVRHRQRAGKSACLRTAAEWARGGWIVTMDGDGQNLADDIRAIADQALAHGSGPPPLIAGIRTRRLDTLSRRIATRIANPIRRWALRDDCPDSGCGIKAYRRDAFLRLPVFEGMHRFLPALFRLYGHPLVFRPVAHRAREHGQSKYTNWRRALVGIVDLLGVVWLRQRTHVPQVDGPPVDGDPASNRDP